MITLAAAVALICGWWIAQDDITTLDLLAGIGLLVLTLTITR